MDVLMDSVFWGDVGLAAASRLAVLAALLWAVKMLIERQIHDSVAVTAPPDAAGRTGHTRLVLRRAAEMSTTSEADRPVVAAHAATSRRDALRERLLHYVEERAAERQRL